MENLQSKLITDVNLIFMLHIKQTIQTSIEIACLCVMHISRVCACMQNQLNQFKSVIKWKCNLFGKTLNVSINGCKQQFRWQDVRSWYTLHIDPIQSSIQSTI